MRCVEPACLRYRIFARCVGRTTLADVTDLCLPSYHPHYLDSSLCWADACEGFQRMSASLVMWQFGDVVLTVVEVDVPWWMEFLPLLLGPVD